MHNQIIHLEASRLAQLIAARELSPVEVVQAHLDRIAETNSKVNAIVTHGTMCLLRRTALADAGGWSSDTIVEDTDLASALIAG